MVDSSLLADAASTILSGTGIRPSVGVMLGSGLGGLADQLRDAVTIPYGEIAGFPCPTVPGHQGTMVLGRMEGVEVAAMKGRVHLFEGYSPAQVVYPVRLLHALGVRTLVVTNAAGGLRPDLQAGTLMMLEDHINLPGLVGLNPLIGLAGDQDRFVNMSAPYDAELRGVALEAGRQAGIRVSSGVYVMVAGPSFESPAEVRMLRQWGADAVGMSTVPEVITARWLAMRVLGISCITNANTGVLGEGDGGHTEVLAVAQAAVPGLAALLGAVVRSERD